MNRRIRRTLDHVVSETARLSAKGRWMEMLKQALRDHDPWAVRVSLRDYLPDHEPLWYAPGDSKEVESYAGYSEPR